MMSCLRLGYFAISIYKRKQLYTKTVDSVVGALWLATETRDGK